MTLSLCLTLPFRCSSLPLRTPLIQLSHSVRHSLASPSLFALFFLLPFFYFYLFHLSLPLSFSLSFSLPFQSSNPHPSHPSHSLPHLIPLPFPFPFSYFRCYAPSPPLPSFPYPSIPSSTLILSNHAPPSPYPSHPHNTTSPIFPIFERYNLKTLLRHHPTHHNTANPTPHPTLPLTRPHHPSSRTSTSFVKHVRFSNYPPGPWSVL